MKKAALLIFAMLFVSVSAFAQGSLDEKIFEELHGHASFNVVFAVLSVILVGVLIALWRLDVKVNKLLKEVKK